MMQNYNYTPPCEVIKYGERLQKSDIELFYRFKRKHSVSVAKHGVDVWEPSRNIEVKQGIACIMY